MNVLAILIGLGGDIKKGSRWQASHKVNGVQTPKRPAVTAFDCGIESGRPWIRHTFTEDGQEHILNGRFGYGNDGEEILFDDTDVDSDDLIVSNRTQLNGVKAVLEYEFTLDGKSHRYRFDAPIARWF